MSPDTDLLSALTLEGWRIVQQVTIKIVIALMALLSSAASAGVVYRWQDLTFNQYLGPVTSWIEIDAAYWTPGGTLSYQFPDPEVRIPGMEGSGYYFKPDWLEDFYFGPAGTTSAGVTPVKLNDRPCSIDFCPDEYVGDLIMSGYYTFDLTFNSIMTGSIYANNDSSHVRMHSDGAVWTVDDFRTDGSPAPCFVSGFYCAGGTGLWVLDQSTVPVATPVPEPEMVAMFTLGLAIVLTASRRRTLPAPIAPSAEGNCCSKTAAPINTFA